MVPGLTGGNNAFYKAVMATFTDTLSYLPFEPASRGRFQARSFPPATRPSRTRR